MSKSLWQKHTYISNIDFVIGTPMREFDISKANISVLRDANILTEQQYLYYLNCDRMERQIAIGKLQGSNPEVVEILKAGILNAKRIFVEANNIDDSEILYIRNDAICIIGDKYISRLQITDRVAFRESARYTSFYRFGTVHLLYSYDIISKNEHMDVKGLGSDDSSGLRLHKDYMLDFLSELFYTAQVEGAQNAIKLLSIVYKRYISMEMPIEYYRELNPLSNYRLKSEFSNNSTLYLSNAIEWHKQFIDISFNESLFRHLNKIYASIILK